VVERDRALMTHMHPPPVPTSELLCTIPPARIGFAHLDPEPRDWFRSASSDGMLVFADTGWDQDEKWSPSVLDQLENFHAFLPNSVEAMAYTHTDDPHDALHALAERVPVAVVTCGGQGAIAIDSTTSEQEWVPALPVNAHDPTGAGDVFGAAFVLGTLDEWPLRQRLAFANLCAALSVQYVGGSLAAPRWGERATRAARPLAVTTASAIQAWRSLISLSRYPPGASHAAAPMATRRSTSRPSAPPSSAARGSWARASAGKSPISLAGTYGTLAARIATRPRSTAGSGAYRSPW